MELTTDLMASTPDYSLTLFDRGVYSLGLLMSRKVKGKKVQVLTSMTDPMRFPAADIVDLYSYRWRIELGNRLTLRSRTPDMVRQELWGVARLQLGTLSDGSNGL